MWPRGNAEQQLLDERNLIAAMMPPQRPPAD